MSGHNTHTEDDFDLLDEDLKRFVNDILYDDFLLNTPVVKEFFKLEKHTPELLKAETSRAINLGSVLRKNIKARDEFQDLYIKYKQWCAEEVQESENFRMNQHNLNFELKTSQQETND
jgi:hypothetical protein